MRSSFEVFYWFPFHAFEFDNIINESGGSRGHTLPSEGKLNEFQYYTGIHEFKKVSCKYFYGYLLGWKRLPSS